MFVYMMNQMTVYHKALYEDVCFYFTGSYLMTSSMNIRLYPDDALVYSRFCPAQKQIEEGPSLDPWGWKQRQPCYKAGGVTSCSC